MRLVTFVNPIERLYLAVDHLKCYQIICGMGKTGTMHAWEQEGIRGPDIQTIGKALGAGFVPLSGVLLHEKIFQALSSGSGGLAHGHTFQVFLFMKHLRLEEKV